MPADYSDDDLIVHNHISVLIGQESISCTRT